MINALRKDTTYKDGVKDSEIIELVEKHALENLIQSIQDRNPLVFTHDVERPANLNEAGGYRAEFEDFKEEYTFIEVPTDETIFGYLNISRYKQGLITLNRLNLMHIIEDLILDEKFKLFKYLSELKYNRKRTFYDQLLKEGLDELAGEDCEKWLQPKDKKAEFQKLALELYPKYFCDAHGYLMDSLGRKIE